MKKKPLLIIDIDDTVYSYAPCHQNGLDAAYQCAMEINLAWKNKDIFLSKYNEARNFVKEDITLQAASHSRLLYFKRMLEQHFSMTKIRETFLLHEAYWRGYFEDMSLDDDCKKILTSLKKQDFQMLFLTNFTTFRQLKKLQHLNLEDLGMLCVTSEEVGIEKPSPKNPIRAIQRWPIPVQEICVIGDDLHADQMIAHSLNIPFVWRRREKNNNLSSPPIVLEHWSQLPSIIRSLS